jgi:transposase-like protein
MCVLRASRSTQEEETMAKSKMDLSAFVGKLLEEEDGDTLREGIRVLSQALMESEVSGLIGAERYERSGERSSYRNGYRLRSWDTRVGTIELAIPRVRTGSYFPSLLEPRRRAERALQSVVQEAYVHGVSTRKVDEILKALGMDGMSKSQVSRICAELDTEVEAFRSRPIEDEHPYLWIDATYHKVRQDGRVQSMATVVAVGVTVEGERQILGVDAGPSEDGPFWTAFLRSLVKRGLKGVRLVVSDAHEGLKKATQKVLSGASWQRCRVHFMRNLLATIPHSAREPVAAIVRTIFAQPDAATAMAQLHKVADGLHKRFPQAAALLEEAAEDILAHRAFPNEHRRQLHSTNPLERLNKEIKRRSNVVGIFPNRAALLRLVGAILAEQDDEWSVAERRYFSIESMRQLTQPSLPEGQQEELLAAVS